jgi:uncharacterized membrane protein
MSPPPVAVTRRTLLAAAATALAARLAAAAGPTRPATRPRLRVLYLDGYPRWEYRYLRDLLVRHPDVAASLVLYSSPADPPRGADRAVAGVPVTADGWRDFDVLVVGDVDPRQLTTPEIEAMARFVERGGGLAMSAGPRFAPAAYRGTPLADALPVAAPDQPPVPPDGRRGFRLSRTAAGRRAACFRVWDDERENERFLTDEVAPLYWYSAGVAAKPGAVVWAEHPTDLAADGGKAPVVVAGDYGKGRAVFVGVDDTWRWRFRREVPFSKFWLGVFEHLRPAGAE